MNKKFKRWVNFFGINFFVLGIFTTTLKSNDLVGAVKRGDYERVKVLLESRLCQDQQFDASLFTMAARGEHADHRIVALLMRYGLCDVRCLENLSRAFLHGVREYYQRLPEPGFSDDRLGEQGVAYLEALNQNGIVRISGLLSDAEVMQLQKDFQKFVDSMDDQRARGINVEKRRDDYYDPETNLYHCNNPFKLSQTLVDFCCNELVCSVINNYLEKVGYIVKGWATHYMPGGKEVSIFKWHHDKSGQRVKMMILLGDVEERSRHLSYVLGSHAISHDFETYIGTSGDLDYYRKKFGKEPVIFKALGKAGDIFLFDTNGIHKANCGELARDTFIITYSADKQLVFKSTLPFGAFDGLTVDERHPFFRTLAAQSRQYFAPQYGGWLGSLEHVDSWY
ncbi:phytanoyl-CoA dioxygenase family protein [Candidatus Babeliales bacterium]|nr:phytanoyl-CoA dioxygenase family protein [Candidatus Babeliales bacterium]